MYIAYITGTGGGAFFILGKDVESYFSYKLACI